MNASIVSLLIAATPLPGAPAGAFAADGSGAWNSLEAAAPMASPDRTHSLPASADERAGRPARRDCGSPLRLQSPDGALLFIRGTRYSIG